MAEITREQYEALPYYENGPVKVGGIQFPAYKSSATDRYNAQKLRGCDSWVEKVVQFNRETGEFLTECRPWTIIPEGDQL